MQAKCHIAAKSIHHNPKHFIICLINSAPYCILIPQQPHYHLKESIAFNQTFRTHLFIDIEKYI